jgi:ATP-dependent Zn protease
MNEEATRSFSEHRDKCQAKLNILLEQRTNLSTAIDDLLQTLRWR